MPFWRDSATFSAACRQTLQVRNNASPSTHWLDCESNRRGVAAMRKLETAAPDGVNRSSGSATVFPTTVMGVSLCAMRLSSAGVQWGGGDPIHWLLAPDWGGLTA